MKVIDGEMFACLLGNKDFMIVGNQKVLRAIPDKGFCSDVSKLSISQGEK
jgi:hypothetical protein